MRKLLCSLLLLVASVARGDYATPEISDDAFRLFDETDPTKALRFDLGTQVAGHTVTLKTTITSSNVTITIPTSVSGTLVTDTSANDLQSKRYEMDAGYFYSLSNDGTYGADAATVSMVVFGDTNGEASYLDFSSLSGSGKMWSFQNATGTLYQTSGTDVAIADGGTGQSTATLGFNALSPVTTRGDLIVRGATNNQRLAVGGANTILASDGTDPSWRTIVNADINASAAIAYSKLNLATSIVNADVGTSAAIAYSKLATLNTGQLLLGNAGTPTATTMGGDATIGATGTLDLANDAVTYDEIQNVSAASRLLGRGSAGGSGDAEEITLGNGLSMSTTTLNAMPRMHVTLAASVLTNTLAAAGAALDSCTLALTDLTTTKRRVGQQVNIKMDGFGNARGVFRLKNAGGQSGQISCRIRNVTDSSDLVASTNVTTGTTCTTAEGTGTPALTGVKQFACECSGGNATDDPLLGYCGLELSP